MLLGCIADDLTGATDLGVTLAREGLSVVQVNGTPEASLDVPAADAIVVALEARRLLDPSRPVVVYCWDSA